MLVQINDQWMNLNTLTGQPVGTALLVQSQSSSRVYVKQQATQPDASSVDAIILDFKDLWQVTDGSEITWVRVADRAGQLFVEVM